MLYGESHPLLVDVRPLLILRRFFAIQNDKKLVPGKSMFVKLILLQ